MESRNIKERNDIEKMGLEKNTTRAILDAADLIILKRN